MTSFYLKYRPQRIADLDLKSVREFLERLATEEQSHHAYLFAGPRGTGKTSAARILAKMVNCGSKQKPCDKCENCAAITRGNFPDLIEIDAASNRGIDDVRALRETVALAPIQGKVKVYLIDEVHMLTAEAFNALLKTLEEPPDKVVFVLATTEPEKVPETVISRCIRVNFGRATLAEMKRSLAKVVEAEKLTVDEKGLLRLAAAAEGSFRDAQKMLEQLVMGRQKEKITLEQVEAEVGMGKGGGGREWLGQLVKRQTNLALTELERLSQAGVPVKVIIETTIEAVRRQLWRKLGLDQEDKDETATEGEELTIEEMKLLLRMLLQAGREVKEALVPQVPLELLTVEWCGSEKLKVQSEKLPEIKIQKRQGNVKFEEVQARWQEILARLKPKNHSLAGLLRSSKPTGVDGNKLMIEVFYQFHLDQLKQEKFRQLVEDAVAEVFAFPLRLEYILGERQEGMQRKQSPAAADEAIVKAAEEIFGG